MADPDVNLVDGMIDRVIKAKDSIPEVKTKSPFSQLVNIISSEGKFLSQEEIKTLIGLLEKTVEPLYPYPSYEVSVNYDRSVEALASLSVFEVTNYRITSDKFPSDEKGKAKITIYMVNFDEAITTQGVIAELDKQGLRPATLKELLALGNGSKFDPQQNQYFIALGSKCKNSIDDEMAPIVHKVKYGSLPTILDLVIWNSDIWESYCYFAAVKK